MNAGIFAGGFISIKSYLLVFFILVGIFKYLNSNSEWSLDFLALIDVVPEALRAANITLLLHCAEPLFSKYLIPFTDCEPRIDRGNLFFFFIIKFSSEFFQGYSNS